jgi:octaprenyl-diphosphate synthase
VHDDVMDEARIRRKRPTLGSKWGNATAVLLGDCLFAQALRLAAGFPTTEVCRAVSEATNTVCAGEILQTGRRRTLAVSIDEYFRILEMKTGELFAVSCELGALLADGGEPHRAAMRRFGLHLGTAYQIFDDCLDLFGNEALAGKSLGTDLVTGKLTLPVLVTLERVEPGQRDTMMKMLRHWSPEWLGDLQRLMEEHGAVGATMLALESRLHGARAELAALPDSSAKTSLLDLTGFLQQQAAEVAAMR